ARAESDGRWAVPLKARGVPELRKFFGIVASGFCRTSCWCGTVWASGRAAGCSLSEQPARCRKMLSERTTRPRGRPPTAARLDSVPSTPARPGCFLLPVEQLVQRPATANVGVSRAQVIEESPVRAAHLF